MLHRKKQVIPQSLTQSVLININLNKGGDEDNLMGFRGILCLF